MQLIAIFESRFKSNCAIIVLPSLLTFPDLSVVFERLYLTSLLSTVNLFTANIGTLGVTYTDVKTNINFPSKFGIISKSLLFCAPL